MDTVDGLICISQVAFGVKKILEDPFKMPWTVQSAQTSLCT